MLFKNQEKIFQFLTFLLLNTWSASSVFARFSHTFHSEKYQKKVKKKRNGETHKDVIKEKIDELIVLRNLTPWI